MWDYAGGKSTNWQQKGWSNKTGRDGQMITVDGQTRGGVDTKARAGLSK